MKARRDSPVMRTVSANWVWVKLEFLRFVEAARVHLARSSGVVGPWDLRPLAREAASWAGDRGAWRWGRRVFGGLGCGLLLLLLKGGPVAAAVMGRARVFHARFA